MFQKQLQQVTRLEAARALRQHKDFLGLFVQPRSPTDIAGTVAMAPNLAHHHARKLTDLGLLFQQRREGRKVYYQLSALEFRVSSRLLPPQDDEGNGTATIRDLSRAFLQAYERSWNLMHDCEEDIYGFGTGTQEPPLPPPPTAKAAEPYPTHLDSLTLCLSPERYRHLARALSALLDEAAREGHSPDAPHCTLTVLTFRHEHLPGGQHLSRQVDSFLGAEH